MRYSFPSPSVPSETSEQLWSAFDAAISRARAGLDAEASAGADVFFAALRKAVEAHIGGGGCLTFAAEDPTLARRMIDSVRLAFIEEMQAAHPASRAAAIEVLGALGVCQDSIATLSVHEPELHDAGKEKSLGLAVEIAHDIRSPLTAILFLIDVVRSGRSGAVSAAQARQLGIVYSAALGLNQLATDLIDHVRGHDREFEQQPIPFSVTELLNTICDILAPVSEERSLEIRLVTLASDTRVGHPAVLHRILLNLATNALKFTAKGSVTILARPLKGSRVEFCVADSGPGLSRAVQDHLFEPFATRATDGRSFSSSGLGLAICKNLVQKLGGELRVSSKLGKGTRFTFVVDLPVEGGREAAAFLSRDFG